MSTQTEPNAKPRIPLSKERVLRAAVALADEGGIESLTMRKLAQSLGVEAMSLYYHVANKDNILDGMVDVVFSEIDLPPIGAGWKPAMRERAISTRQVLSLHPWAASMMQSRPNPGPALLRHHNWVIGTLRESGFSIELTAHAFSAMDAYIYGFSLQEETLPFDGAEEVAAIVETFLEHFPTDEYPYLAELSVEHIMKPGYDYGDEFEFGLDLVLDGLELAQSKPA